MTRRPNCFSRITHHASRITHALVGCGLMLGLFLVTGCRTSHPYSASFASVVIHGKTQDEIRQVTAQVFRENGYQATRSLTGEMRFEKEGTRGQTLAHGNLASMTEGRGVLVRVKAEIVHLESGAERLQCKVFMVTDAGDSFFEDESPLGIHKRKPYQKLLDQVAERLK